MNPATITADSSGKIGRKLTIRDLTTTVVEVPMNYPLGTSAATVRSAPLLLVDLHTEEGITGRTYLFCYRTSGAKAIALMLHDALDIVRGEQVAPISIGQTLARRFALLGVVGTARMALAALDGALWDALAQSAGLPLATFLGAAPKPVAAYNSSGLGLMKPEAAADEAESFSVAGSGPSSCAWDITPWRRTLPLPAPSASALPTKSKSSSITIKRSMSRRRSSAGPPCKARE
jgi:Mandelate racemase / muconate lactonizing enzyme, N-terminal domain